MKVAGWRLAGGISVLIATLLAMLSCKRSPRQHILTGEAMGTTYRIKIMASSEPSEAKAQVDAILSQLDRTLSTWRADSWVSAFNASSSTQPTEVPAIVWPLLVQAEALADETEGRFDITLGRLVEFWGFGPYRSMNSPPCSAGGLSAAQADCGWTHLNLDQQTRSVMKLQPKLALDFSAIAKGYAVDLITEELERAGYDVFLIEFGGEVAARGSPPGQRGWRIRLPRQEAPHILVNSAMATSGSDHQQRGELSHLIDPATGHPTPLGQPITVEASTCTRADALATAAAVLAAREPAPRPAGTTSSYRRRIPGTRRHYQFSQ